MREIHSFTLICIFILPIDTTEYEQNVIKTGLKNNPVCIFMSSNDCNFMQPMRIILSVQSVAMGSEHQTTSLCDELSNPDNIPIMRDHHH